MLITEGLQYHLDNNLSLCDSIYREGSQGFLDLICEARALYNAGHISLFEEDLDLVNSDLGTCGIYEGRKVMLVPDFFDFPVCFKGAFASPFLNSRKYFFSSL